MRIRDLIRNTAIKGLIIIMMIMIFLCLVTLSFFGFDRIIKGFLHALWAVGSIAVLIFMLVLIHKMKMKEKENPEEEIDTETEIETEEPLTKGDKVRNGIAGGIFVVVGGLLAVMGMTIFITGFMESLETKHDKTPEIPNGQLTFATIKEVIPNQDSKGNEEDPSFLVDYEVDGVEYEQELKAYSSEFEKGSKVQIVYDPEEPTKIAVSKSKVFIIICLVIMAQGVLTLFLAGVIIAGGYKIISKNVENTYE